MREIKLNLTTVSFQNISLISINKKWTLWCYQIQETAVFQIYSLGSPKNKTKLPKCHILYLETPSPAQIVTQTPVCYLKYSAYFTSSNLPIRTSNLSSFIFTLS